MKRHIHSRRPRRFAPAVECLESRLAPAWLVDATTVRFYDVDGDVATVQFSSPVLTAANVNSVFGFNFGDVYTGPLPGPIQPVHQLQILNLTTLPNGLEVRITAEADMGGDGLVNVGFINANGRDVALVKVEGDLGRIQVGDATLTTKALGELRVDSLGGMGLSTQPPGGNLNSIILGKLGLLKVKGDIVSASVEAIGGPAARIGQVLVDGSLVGGSGAFSGRIGATGDLGPITIGGSIVAGSGDFSGAISSNGSIRWVTLVGDILGSSAVYTGSIYAANELGDVTIGGSVVGAVGDFSGQITSSGNMGQVTIEGTLKGGVGVSSGSVVSLGHISRLRVGENVIGEGNNSGVISAGGNLGLVTIAGGLMGGTGSTSGRVTVGGSIGDVKVGRTVVGGGGIDSGQIYCLGNMGKVTIGYHSPEGIRGDIGNYSGQIFSAGKIAEVWVGGDIHGQAGFWTGSIIAVSKLGPVVVSGSIRGGSGHLSGMVGSTAGRVSSVEVGGNLESGLGFGSGSIRAADDLGAITIHGGIIGTATNPVIISGRGQKLPTTTSDLAIAALTVDGNVNFAQVLGGYSFLANPVNGNASIGAVVVKGNWTASTVAAGVTAGIDAIFATADDTLIAGGSPTILAKIASLNIKGSVSGSPAPGDGFGFFAEKIGSLKIGGIVSALNPGAHNDDYFIGPTGDLKVHEL